MQERDKTIRAELIEFVKGLKIRADSPGAKDYPAPVEQKQQAKLQEKQIAELLKLNDEIRTLKLWEAIAAQFDVSDLGITKQPRPMTTYMQLSVGYAYFHYEWLHRLHDPILRVAIHSEASDRAVNERRLQQVSEHRNEIVQGINYPFVTEIPRKWATAEFRMPYDDTMPLESVAAEASRVMRLLIERTWPFMEPILKNEKTQQPPPSE